MFCNSIMLQKLLRFILVFFLFCRLSPIIPFQARIIANPMVLQGYEIPANTFVMWVNSIFGLDEDIFPQAEAFIPEREFSQTMWKQEGWITIVKICPKYC